MRVWQVCLICLGAIPIVYGGFVIKDKRDFAGEQERLKAIASKAGRGPTHYITFRGSTFLVKQFVAEKGKPGMLTKEEIDVFKNPQCQRLQKRLNWLFSTRGTFRVDLASIEPQKGKANVFCFKAFGVIASETSDSSGRKKLYAFEPFTHPFMVSTDINETNTPWPKNLKVAKREDFINPQDIDWMFGVEDFSRIASDGI